MGFSDPLFSILTLGTEYDNDPNWFPSWCVETNWNSIMIRLKSLYAYLVDVPYSSTL